MEREPLTRIEQLLCVVLGSLHLGLLGLGLWHAGRLVVALWP